MDDPCVGFEHWPITREILERLRTAIARSTGMTDDDLFRACDVPPGTFSRAQFDKAMACLANRGLLQGGMGGGTKTITEDGVRFLDDV